MPITVRVPSSLERWFDGKDVVTCTGKDISECIDNLDATYPGIRNRIIDETGEISAMLVFLNGDNIRNLAGLKTAVNDGDEISVIPMAAGG